MSGWRAVVALSAALAWGPVPGAAQAASTGDQEPPEVTFRTDVRLVRMLVTVKDARGAPAGDLTREEFRVRDNGEERPIAVFETRTDRPLSVALLMDASLSTLIELPFEKQAAERFFANLLGPDAHPRDRAAVLKFSDFIDLATPFTNDEKQLARALKRIRAESGTSLYDAIVLAADELEKRAGRRVIVIITDGGDTTSQLQFSDALEAAHAVDAVIYGVLVSPIKSDAGRNTGGENALRTLCGNTGGMMFVEPDAENLDAAFDEILRSLRTQYLIAYYPPEHTPAAERFRRVEVSVTRPGTTVLARTGYFVPENPPAAPAPFSDRISISPKPHRWRSVEEPEPPPEAKGPAKP